MFRDRTIAVIFFIVMLSGTLAQKVQANNFVISAPHDAKHVLNVTSQVVNAYKRLGIGATIKFLPAKRSLLEAKKSNRFDAELARIAMADASLSQMLRVPVALHQIQFQILSLADSFNAELLTDTQYIRFGAVRGIICTDLLLADYNATFAHDVLHAIQLLKAGRVDALIMPRAYEQAVYARQPDIDLQDIKHFDAPIKPLNLYHYIKRDHEALLDDLTHALSLETGNAIESASSVVANQCQLNSPSGALAKVH